jgi:hypothetical protein
MEAVKAIKFTQRNVSWLGGSTHFLTGFLGGSDDGKRKCTKSSGY